MDHQLSDKIQEFRHRIDQLHHELLDEPSPSQEKVVTIMQEFSGMIDQLQTASQEVHSPEADSGGSGRARSRGRQGSREIPARDSLARDEILESITDGLLLIGRDWRIRYMNQAAAQNGFFTPEELIGRDLWQAFPSLLGTPLETHYRQAMENRKPAHFEMKGVVRDKWYLISVYPSSSGIAVYWQDNTYRVQMERELSYLLVENQYQTALLDAVFDADPSGLAVLVGPDLRFARVNPAYRFVTPDPSKDPIGRLYDEVWPKRSKHSNRVRFRNVIQTGQPYLISGIEHSFPDGSRRIFTLQARRIEWDNKPACLLILWDTTEVARANQVLVESGERLRLALEGAQEGTWDWNLTTGELIWDRRCKEMFGLPQDARVTYALFLEMVHPADRQTVEAALASSLRDQTVLHEEYRTVWPDGTLHWIRVRGQGYFGEDGKAYRMSGTVLDITEHKRLTVALRESEERFRILADSSPLCIWVSDPQGGNRYVNRTYCEYFGVTPEQVEGSDWQPFLHPDDAPAYLDAFLRAVAAHTPFQGETRVRRADGSWRWLFNYAVPRFSENGEYLGHVGNSADITERKLGEQAVEAARAEAVNERNRLAAVLEALPVGVLIVDEQGGIVQTNPMYGHIWSGPLPEIHTVRDYSAFIGWWAETGKPVDPEEWASALALKKGEAVVGQLLRIQRFDGSFAYVHNSAVPIRDARGQVAGCVVAIQDISERMEAEKALRESRERLRLTTEAAEVGMWSLQMATHQLSIDPSVRAMLHLPEDAPVDPFSLAGRIHPDDLVQVEAMVDQIMKSPQRLDVEFRITLPDGSQRWLYVRAQALPGSDGQMEQLTGLVMDITERKQAEEMLAFQAGLLERVHDAVVATDEQLRVTYWNPVATEIFGWTAEEAIGRSSVGLFGTKVPRSSSEQALEQLKENGWYEGEVRYRRKDGTYFDAHSRSATLSGPNGEFKGFVTSVRDITESIRTEAEDRARAVHIELQRRLLDQREQERQQIARDLHDGPVQELTSLNFALQGMQGSQSCPDMDAQIRAIQSVVQELIGELRAYAGELRPPTLAKFGLGKAIRSHLETYQGKHPELKIDFDESQAGGLIPDEMRVALFRIYQETLTNIAKHAQATRVAVRFVKTPAQAVLEIQDNGTGFQVPNDWLALARQGHLGLVGMRERAEALGGTLAIHSEPENGTLIRVEVPLDKK